MFSVFTNVATKKQVHGVRVPEKKSSVRWRIQEREWYEARQGRMSGLELDIRFREVTHSMARTDQARAEWG
jgi:hypothetical protein